VNIAGLGGDTRGVGTAALGVDDAWAALGRFASPGATGFTAVMMLGRVGGGGGGGGARWGACSSGRLGGDCLDFDRDGDASEDSLSLGPLLSASGIKAIPVLSSGLRKPLGILLERFRMTRLRAYTLWRYECPAVSGGTYMTSNPSSSTVRLALTISGSSQLRGVRRVSSHRSSASFSDLPG
jgi:hypothetical protein